ncbi:MAG: hypothetical protein JNK54_06300 [Elusimicrobia bacterium]|nr:hypothetical protein [Elusimicrobiota bacterium]
MKHNHFHLIEPNRLFRRFLAGFVAFVYGATNVVFCHAAEASFWSSRRNAAQKVGKTNASAPSLPSPNDALILAQLPGGVRLDFHGPVESSVMPVSPKEHLVGGKIPVFERDLPRWLADVIAPYGNMRDVFLSKRPGAPLVIQIQDLHDSTEAQRNIAGLVEALQDERGVNLVGLEGAQGAFATEAFRSFPDADITKAVAEHFMEEGYLGGPEFAGITAKRMPLLWGVEDMDAYKANVTAVKNSAANRPEVEAFLRKARGILADVKDQRLSPKLLEFDRHLTGYHSRKEPLGVYTRYLLRSSMLSRAHFPNLVLLQDALHWEDSLDFKRIESERAVLLERLVSGLSKSSLTQLVDRSAMYRLGRISYGDYYRFLRKLCSQSGINLEEFSQLSAYVRYVLLAEKINRNDLLTELSTLERSVQDGLAVTNDERRIVLAARHLALLERLVQHGYTPADWLYHITHETEIQRVGTVIQSLAQESGLPEALSPPAPETLKPFEEFCLQALGRNGALVQNLMAKMVAEKSNTAILVAGGFHTEGLTQLLRQKDISYAVVTPKVNGTLPDGHRTLELLARDPAPLEKLFAGETINIPTPRMVAIGNISDAGDGKGFGLASKLATLLVAIVLGLSVQSTQVPLSTPAHFPEQIQAKAVPVPTGVNVSFSGGNKFFIPTDPQSGLLSEYQADIPGYGNVSVRPVPKSRPLKVQIRDSFSSMRAWPNRLSTRFELGWEWLLGFIGLGTIRRVGFGQTADAVSPPQPATRALDTTAKPLAPMIMSIVSIESQIMLAMEKLEQEIPREGLTRELVIQGITEKTILRDIPEHVRGPMTVHVGELSFDAQGRLTKEIVNQWLADHRKMNNHLKKYILQKPSTYELLERWKNSTENTLKNFLGRHDIFGTSLIEEIGVLWNWGSVWEGRVPAALAGVGLGILAIVFSLTIVQGVGLAVAGSFIWSMVGPQLKFVLDHGSDQTDLQRRVRMGGTFLLNLVAVSVSAVVLFVGFQVGVDGTLWVLVSLSPVLGLVGAILTHAILEVLDILPDASPLSSKTFENLPEHPSINQDPLGKPLTGEEETQELVEKWGGKSIEALDEVFRVVADHDLGGSVNDLTNKHSVGVLGDSRSVDVVSASEGFSPYWWQRYWIKEGITQVQGEIRKGPGGDDYKMIFNERDLKNGGKTIEAALTEVIDAENDVMRDQFAFYSLEGPQFANGKEEETAYLEKIANAFKSEIGPWGRMSIVRHGNGVTIAVKRDYPGENLNSIENRLDNLGSWERLDTTRPGLGLFTYSMGGVRLGDVVRRLTDEYPKLQLLAEDGTLRPEMVPVVMMWADRLAEDMLAVAKGRGRKQVFIANDLAEVYSFERPGTVKEDNIKQTMQEHSDPSHDAFKVPKAEEFWKGLKKEVSGHVLIYEVAQYRKQGLRWGVNATSEWVFRHLPSVLFRFVPERWVRGLEKRIQSRAFHSWQGSDQHGKGNDAIKAHHEMVTSLGSEPTKLGRAVDTFYSLSRGPPSIDQLVSAADTMRNKLATQHPDEKKKLQPFHVVYDFNLGDWAAFLRVNRTEDTNPSDRVGPRLSLEDVAAMQNAVVTYLGRRYGGEILLEKLREFFVVQPSEDVFLLSMDVKSDRAKERFRKMELVFRKAQAENARAAKLVLNARAPIRMGSFIFSMMAKGVERVMKVSPARARQIVSGRYVQSLLVPLAELPFLPYLSVGLSLLVASVMGPWVGVIAGSFLMALIHGKPVMTRGPPSSLVVPKDDFGRPIESQQTIKQFTIRFLVALSINTFAVFVGGLDPTLFFTPQSLPLESLNLLNAGLTGYFSHALYNFVVPESYRLSLGTDPNEIRDITERGSIAEPNRTSAPSPELQALIKKTSDASFDWHGIQEEFAQSIQQRWGEEASRRFLRIVDGLPFVRQDAKGSWVPDQPELFMKAVVQELRPVSNARDNRSRRKEDRKKRKGADERSYPGDADLMEYVFYFSRSVVQGMLREKREAYARSKTIVELTEEEQTIVLKSVAGFGTLAARLGWSTMAIDLTDAGMELWRPQDYYLTKASYDKRMGTDEMGRNKIAEKILGKLKTVLGKDYEVLPRFDGFTLSKPEAFVTVRAKDIFSLMSKLMREKRKGRDYSLDHVQDLFTAKIVLPNSKGLREWGADVAEVVEKINSELKTTNIEDYDVRDRVMGGATYVTVLIRINEGSEEIEVPLELQFFSHRRYRLLERMAGVGGNKTKPYWIYKASDFFRNIFSDGKEIVLTPNSYVLQENWRENISMLAQEWDQENVVQVKTGSAVKYVSLPNRGEKAATFIDLAAMSGLIKWENNECFASTPFVGGNGNLLSASLENPIPLGATIEWKTPIALPEASRAILRLRSSEKKTAHDLTSPEERRKHKEKFDLAFQWLTNSLSRLVSRESPGILNPLFLLHMWNQPMLKQKDYVSQISDGINAELESYANHLNLSLDEFKTLVVGDPKIIIPVFGRFSSDPAPEKHRGYEPPELIKAREIITSFVESLVVSTGGRNFVAYEIGDLLDLLVTIGVFNQEQKSQFQYQMYEGSIVTSQDKNQGSKFFIDSKDRPGLFNRVMKIIVDNGGKLVRASSSRGRKIAVFVAGNRENLDSINSALKQIPLRGGHVSKRDLQVKLEVEFPEGRPTESLDLTSLTAALSRWLASLGGNINSLSVSTEDSGPSIQFIVDLTETAYERLMDMDAEGNEHSSLVRKELDAVQGDLSIESTEIVNGVADPLAEGKGIGVLKSPESPSNLYSAAFLLGGMYGNVVPVVLDPLLGFGIVFMVVASVLVWMTIHKNGVSKVFGDEEITKSVKRKKNPLESVWKTFWSAWGNLIHGKRWVLGLALMAVLLGFPIDALGAESLSGFGTGIGILQEGGALAGGGLGLVLMGLGIKKIGRDRSKYFVGLGGTNGVKVIEFGLATHFKSLVSDGEVVRYVSYSLQNPGDSEALIANKVGKEKARLREAYSVVSGYETIKDLKTLALGLDKIEKSKVNAQAAIVDVLDGLGGTADSHLKAEIQSFKKDLLNHMAETHSLEHLGLSDQDLERAIKRERELLLRAIGRVQERVERLKNTPLPEGANAEQIEQHQQLLELAGVDEMVLKDLENEIGDLIKSRKQSAFGALRLKLKGIEIEPDMEEKLKEMWNQEKTLILSVMAETHERVPSGEIETEVSRFNEAWGKKSFSPHTMDGDTLKNFNIQVVDRIREGWSVESALLFVQDTFHLQGLRVGDIVSDLIDGLSSSPYDTEADKVVLIAEEIPTPLDLIKLISRGVRIVGIVSRKGNIGSHVSIVAISYGIPCVTGFQSDKVGDRSLAEVIPSGVVIAVNGASGQVEINPSIQRISELERFHHELMAKERVYFEERHEAVSVPILASPDDPHQVKDVISLGGAGVGLIRTEFLFDNEEFRPLDEEGKPNPHFENYLVEEFEKAVGAMEGKTIDIRVVDNQGKDDKPLAGVKQRDGGQTGIDYLLYDHDGRKVALQEIRAIIRVYQTRKNIRMFFPLVSTPEEARDIDKLIQEAVKSLPVGERSSWDIPPVGYMIETPAGAISASTNPGFLKKAAFLNFGTTDLTKFIFGKTRNAESLGGLLSTNQPIVISHMSKVLKALKNSRSTMDVTLCGALATSRVFWPIAHILNESYPIRLSVAPSRIPEVKYYMRRVGQDKEAIKRIKKLLEEESTTPEQLTAECQKLIDRIDRESKNEKAYRDYMEKLRTDNLRRVIGGAISLVALLGLGMIFASAIWTVPSPEMVGLVWSQAGGLSLSPLSSSFLGLGVLMGITKPWDSLMEIFYGENVEEDLPPIVNKRRKTTRSQNKISRLPGSRVFQPTRNPAADFLFSHVGKPRVDGAELMAGIKKRLGKPLDSNGLKNFSFYVALWLKRYENQNSTDPVLQQAMALQQWADTLRLVGELRDLTGSIKDSRTSGKSWVHVLVEKKKDIKRIRNNVGSAAYWMGGRDSRSNQNLKFVQSIFDMFTLRNRNKSEQWDEVDRLNRLLTIAHDRLVDWDIAIPLPSREFKGIAIVDLEVLGGGGQTPSVGQVAPRGGERNFRDPLAVVSAVFLLGLSLLFIPAEAMAVVSTVDPLGWGVGDPLGLAFMMGGVLGGLGVFGRRSVRRASTRMMSDAQINGRIRQLADRLNNEASNKEDAYRMGQEFVRDLLSQGLSVNDLDVVRNKLFLLGNYVQSREDENRNALFLATQRIRFLMEAAFVLVDLHARLERYGNSGELGKGPKVVQNPKPINEGLNVISEMGKKVVRQFKITVDEPEKRPEEVKLIQAEIERALHGLVVVSAYGDWTKSATGLFGSHDLFSSLLKMTEAQETQTTKRVEGYPLRVEGKAVRSEEESLLEMPEPYLLSVIRRVYLAALKAVEPVNPFQEILSTVLKEIGDARLTEENVRVLFGLNEAPRKGNLRTSGILVSRSKSGGVFGVLIRLQKAQLWTAMDSTVTMRNKDKAAVQFAGYRHTMLYSVLLAGLAFESGVSQERMVREGLGEAGVRALFEQGISASEIRRIQRAIYDGVTGLSLPLRVVPRHDPVRAATESALADLFPLTPGPALMDLILLPDEVEGVQRSLKERKNRLSNLTAGLLEGAKQTNGKVGPALEKVVTDSHNSPEAFQPGPLVMALSHLLQSNKVSLERARAVFANRILQGTQRGTPISGEAIGLLMAMGGSLFEGDRRLGHDEEEVSRVRRLYQGWDFALFLATLSVDQESFDLDASPVQQGLEAFNRVRSQAWGLRDRHSALSEAFGKNEDMLIHLSPAMAQGKRGELTPEDLTQLDFIDQLERRLGQEDERAEDWIKSGKKIGFAVIDPQGESYRQEDVMANLEALLSKKVRGNLEHLKRRPLSFGVISGEKAQGSDQNIVSAKTEIEKLGFDGAVSIFALDIPGVSWDYTGMDERIVSLILALSGGLMCQVSASFTESLKAQRAVKRAA